MADAVAPLDGARHQRLVSRLLYRGIRRARRETPGGEEGGDSLSAARSVVEALFADRGLPLPADVRLWTRTSRSGPSLRVQSPSGGFEFALPSPRVQPSWTADGRPGPGVLVPPTLVADMTSHMLLPSTLPWKETTYAPLFRWCAAYAEQSGLNERTCELLRGEPHGMRVGYLNFKSHFVFEAERRAKVEALVGRVSPLSFFCMAQALVPDALAADSEGGFRPGGPQAISQPFSGGDGPDLERGSAAFWERKVQSAGGPRREAVGWMPGFEPVVFGNPYFCPYGRNWGNVVLAPPPARVAEAEVVHLFRHSDDEETLAALRAYNAALNSGARVDEVKAGLAPKALEALEGIRVHDGGMQGRCLESRCMLVVRAAGCAICSVHLEDRNADVRREQLTVALDALRRFEGTSSVLLVGDLNMVHAGAYTERELERMRALLGPDGTLPELDPRLRSGGFELCNGDVKHESIFCKNVCHILRRPGGGNDFPGLRAGCLYTDAADHSLQVVAWERKGEREGEREGERKGERKGKRKGKRQGERQGERGATGTKGTNGTRRSQGRAKGA